MRKEEYKIMYETEEMFWWFVVKRLFIKRLLERIKLFKNSKILDVGCGTGKNLELLAEYGEACGIDISSLALSFCHRRGLNNIQKASAGKIPFSKNHFDLLTIFDVLYHKNIKDDMVVLKQIWRVLKNDGYLLLTDCAYNFLFGPHDFVVQARQRYTKIELERKLQQTGFKVIKSSYCFFFTFPFFAIQRLLEKLLIKKEFSNQNKYNQIVNSLLIFMGKFESWLLSFINFPFGSSIIILAKKSEE